MTNLRGVDLNLLVVLDALLRERHVTRAADAIGLSQPAMSSALARLRIVFKDELLVRTASGMQPTPRAEALIEPIRQMIGQIERALENDHDFDAVKAVRQFSIRLSDLLSYLLLPSLMAEITRAAPGIRLDVRQVISFDDIADEPGKAGAPSVVEQATAIGSRPEMLPSSCDPRLCVI